MDKNGDLVTLNIECENCFIVMFMTFVFQTLDGLIP